MLTGSFTSGESTMDKNDVLRVRGYPEVITCLTEADMKPKGIRAWILQGQRHQLVFFEMDSSAVVPEHSHDYPQWGIMVDGKMELTVDGQPHIVDKGDEYLIPAGAKHFARFFGKCRVMDLFSEKSRYQAKK